MTYVNFVPVLNLFLAVIAVELALRCCYCGFQHFCPLTTLSVNHT